MKKVTVPFALGVIFYSTVSISGTNPKNLEPVSGEKVIVLEQDFIYTKDLGPSHLTYTLKQGKYTATYQGKKGVYYEGPAGCFSEQNDFGSIEKGNFKHYEPHIFNCGILLDVRNSQKPEIYFYRNSEVSKIDASNGILVKALNDLSMKDINIFAYQPDANELVKALSFQ